MPRDGAPARARLRAAALELYRERGYDATTTAQIAARAGVTERTYFRHFADKREVLFDGEEDLRAILVGAIADAPARESPLQLVLRAFIAAVPMVVANRSIAARRAEIIAVTPALLERSHAKIATLTDALADALVARGTEAATARLVAQVGMAAFEYAGTQWDDGSAIGLERAITAAVRTVVGLGAVP